MEWLHREEERELARNCEGCLATMATREPLPELTSFRKAGKSSPMELQWLLDTVVSGTQEPTLNRERHCGTTSPRKTVCSREKERDRKPRVWVSPM